MKSSFIAYVDESGDEGFVFNPDGSGSSRWFVLSADCNRVELVEEQEAGHVLGCQLETAGDVPGALADIR